MFEIASHGKNEEILMAVLPCMLSYSYIFRKLAAVPTSRQSRYWDFIKDYADEQYAESCKEWSAFAEHKCAGLSVANKKYLADIFEKASLLELAFLEDGLSERENGGKCKMKKVLSIAGSDCSGGAGIQADLKTFSAHGVFGMSVIVSVVAENTSRVIDIQDITPDMIEKQIDAVFEDIEVDAVKNRYAFYTRMYESGGKETITI